MKRCIRLTDIYIALFVINTIQSIAFPTIAFAGLIRVAALGAGIMTLVAQLYFKCTKIRGSGLLILVCGLVLISTCYISVKINPMSQSLLTTSGLLTSNTTITIHTVLFAILSGLNLSTKRIKSIFYILSVAMLIASLLEYSPVEIYNAVLQGKRLGSDVSAVNLFGMTTALLTVFLFYSIQNRKKYFVLKGLCMLLMAVLSASSGSRSALLGLFAGLLMYVWLTNNNNKVITFCKIAFLLFFVLYVFSLFDFTKEILERISTVWTRNDEAVARSDAGRMRMILMGLQRWLKKPVWGYGFNSYALYSREVVSFSGYSHNNYIELLFNDGLVGAFCFYLPRSLTFVWCMQTTKRDHQNRMIRLIMTELIMLLLFDMMIVSYYYLALNYVWILGLGYVRGLKEQDGYGRR